MNRSFWLIAFVALVGALVGHLIGQALQWAPLTAAVEDIGFEPHLFDLLILQVTFGLKLTITVGAAIGMAVALFLILRR